MVYLLNLSGQFRWDKITCHHTTTIACAHVKYCISKWDFAVWRLVASAENELERCRPQPDTDVTNVTRMCVRRDLYSCSRTHLAGKMQLDGGPCGVCCLLSMENRLLLQLYSHALTKQLRTETYSRFYGLWPTRH